MSKETGRRVRKFFYYALQPVSWLLALTTAVHAVIVMLWLSLERYLSCSDE